MPSNPTSERILVVNDEGAVRELVASMLTSAGYQYKPAADGLEALALLDSGEEFDLLLCNLMMPNLNGMELLERTKGRFPDMPFVLETGAHDISVCFAAIRNGAYDYILQPFVEEQLLVIVRRALEYRRLKLESRALQANLESLVEARTDQLQTAMANLERSYDITLEALGDALDLKDKETEGHSRRVTAFTIAIARAMGLAGDQIRTIARGAFLHDLGKLAIPDAILRKPGRLTPDETVIIRQCPYRGYEMIKKIPFLADAADIVYSHRERFDGTGYPRGLVGREIPLGARVVAVASTLDAITSDRPYRAAQSLQYAREEIESWWGRQFDPEVVKVFLEMPENTWVDLRKQIGAQA
jgi:response regulator RpfG family c-di-GMP phosphodiesterase